MAKEPLTLEQLARVNKIFLDAGLMYKPWESQQVQLRKVYVPLPPPVIVSDEYLTGASSPEVSVALARLVRKVEGLRGAFWVPEKQASEKIAEQAVKLLIECFKKGAKGEDLRKLTRKERKTLKY